MWGRGEGGGGDIYRRTNNEKHVCDLGLIDQVLESSAGYIFQDNAPIIDHDVEILVMDVM